MNHVRSGHAELKLVKVLVAGRPSLFRHGLQVILTLNQPDWRLAEVDSFSALLNALVQDVPDLLVLDEQLPGMNRMAGLREMRLMLPQTKVLVLGDSDHRSQVLEYIDAGAHAYLTKAADHHQVLAACNTVLCGGIYAPASFTQPPQPSGPSSRIGHALTAHRPVNLTERQREVFELMAQGYATKSIARELGLAVGTVKVHLAAIYRLLGVHNRTEAVARIASVAPTVPRLSIDAHMGKEAGF